MDNKKASNRKILVAPSILAADFSRLAEEIRDVEKAGCDLIHVDVMDGHFVPNLTIGPPVIRCIRKVTTLPLDVHLMIEEPLRSITSFRKAGADWITVHVEAARDIPQTLEAIRESGAEVGMSLRPKTPVSALEPYLDRLDLILVMTVEPGFGGQAFLPEMVEKVKALRGRFRGKISVDGGIVPETAVVAVRAGANVLVAGTAIFGNPDRSQAILNLRKAI